METDICGCGDSCEYDGDPAELWDEREPVARKEHTCCECKCTIKSGEKYHYVVMIYEGDFSTYKACATCWKLLQDTCAPLWQLRQHLINCWGTDYITGESHKTREEKWKERQGKWQKKVTEVGV